MSPTTRNTLLVGGALIVLALLFTCGPMKSWFGAGEAEVGSTPDVAAGPPPANLNAAGSLAGATAGAIAGGQVGTTDVSDLDSGLDSDLDGAANDQLDEDAAGAVVADGMGGGSTSPSGGPAGGSLAGAAGVTAVAAGTGAGIAAATAGGSSAGGAGSAAGAATSAAAATPLPPVSAGVPDVGVSDVSTPDPAALAAAAAAAAAGAFDSAFPSGAGGPAGSQPAMAGKVVDRFAPPVAAVGGSPMALAASASRFGTSAAGVRNACDSPGAGCQNLRGAGANPPIVGGTRPVPGQGPR